MTTPDENLPYAGTAEAAAPRDPERTEQFAESVPVDPSPQQIDEYRQRLGDESPVERPDDEAS